MGSVLPRDEAEPVPRWLETEPSTYQTQRFLLLVPSSLLHRGNNIEFNARAAIFHPEADLAWLQMSPEHLSLPRPQVRRAIVRGWCLCCEN